MEYEFKLEDFKKAFNFALNYYLNPSKSTIDRTTGKERRLGAILDAFIVGKLVEIGVQNLLSSLNPNKEYILDFAIKSTKEAQQDEDIIKIIEEGKERAPNIFVEIKTTFENEDWIGITVEQLETIKKYKKEKEGIIIFASLNKGSKRTSDLLGMYLKRNLSFPILQNFEDLNLKAKIEYVISSKDIEKNAHKFPKGDLMYETDLFKPTSQLKKKDGNLYKGVKYHKTFNNFDSYLIIPLKLFKYWKKHEPKIGKFNVKGSFELYSKKYKISLRVYLYCVEDTIISNDLFGTYKLNANQGYFCNLETKGRDPILEKNNLWFSKRRFLELLEDGTLENQNKILKRLVKKI